MSYEFSWLIEPSIIFSNADGDVTIEDLERQREVVGAMLEESPRETVHHLVRVQNLGDFPKDIPKLRDFVTDIVQHPKAGLLIVYGIGQNRMVKFFMDVVKSLTHVEMVTPKEPEQIIATLLERDNTLDEAEVRAAVERALGNDAANG